MTIQDVVATVEKWLLLENAEEFVTIVLGCVIANFLKADPVWLFIIAPPSSAKTEIIQALYDIPQIYPLSDLTPHTFISGMKGSEKKSSLLFDLDKKIVVLKDFTTVLSMHPEKQKEILSQLREIYDGRYKKAFGTGVIVDWCGKVGFISGVTPIIDTHYSIYSTLGERFIQYRTIQPDPLKMAEMAMGHKDKGDIMRAELRHVIAQFIKQIGIPDIGQIIIPDEIQEKFKNLAVFCVRARSGVIRDNYSREVVYVPEPEAPPRLIKQLSTLACGIVFVQGERTITPKNYSYIHKIGWDTLHQIRRMILEVLQMARGLIDTDSVAKNIGYPTGTVRRYLEDLHCLKLVDVKTTGNKKEWCLSELSISLLEKAKPFP